MRNATSRQPRDSSVGESFRNDPRLASAMRGFVGDFLVACKVPNEATDEILVAVGEAIANACRHGRRPRAPGDVHLRGEMTGGLVSITITDAGPGFNSRAVLSDELPDLLASGGRGFFLMRQLMDEVEVDSSARGTTVMLRRRIAA